MPDSVSTCFFRKKGVFQGRDETRAERIIPSFNGNSSIEQSIHFLAGILKLFQPLRGF